MRPHAWPVKPTIQLHLLGQILLPMLGGAFIFWFLFLSLQLFRLAEYIIHHGLALDLVGHIVGLMSISLIPLVIPLSFLFAVFLVFGRLSNDGEFIAMRALGLSWVQILSPVMLIGAICSAVVIASTTTWAPLASRELRDLVIRVTSTKAVSLIKPGAFTEGVFDLVVFAEKTDSKNNKLENLFVFDGRQGGLAIAAQRGILAPQTGDKTLAASAVFQLEDGVMTQTYPEQESATVIFFREYQMFKENQDSEARAAVKPKAMTIKELRETIEKHGDKMWYDRPIAAPYKIEFHNRFALGIGCLVFALLGPAFSVVHARTGRKSSILMTLLVLGTYYTLFIVGSQVAERAYIPPWMAAWAGNVAAIALSVWRLRKL